jgi:hypothetical protein
MPQGLAGEPALMRQRQPEFEVIDLAALVHASENVISVALDRGAVGTRAYVVADIIAVPDADRSGQGRANDYARDTHS